MKTSKLFTIDVDLAERLKNRNGSELVNGLLKEYFELRSDKNTLKEEKKAVFDAISKKKSNFLKKLRSLMHGIRLIWTTTQNIGSKIISTLRLMRLHITSKPGIWREQNSKELLDTSTNTGGS